MTTIVWFRHDLRITDHPALSAAADIGEAVLPLYLHAPHEEGSWAPGAAARWWMHHSLARLGEELAALGSPLCLRRARDSLSELRSIAKACGAKRVFWCRRYEPAVLERDRRIKEALRAEGIEAQSFNGALLHEPWTVKTKTGGPFQVFTPFWRHCLSLDDPPSPLPAPDALRAPSRTAHSITLEGLELLPTIDWDSGLRETWVPGGAGAHARVHHFLTEAFDDYSWQRDQPATLGTSRLSPYLHAGNLSPREVWHATRRSQLAKGHHKSWRDSQFLAEVGWREFAHHLLFHFPTTPERPLRAKYERFPWHRNAHALHRWQRGQTGYPLVDAGLRELWHTGWMHNRVRMIVASFLVKDLLLPWTAGAAWFWDTLVDADLANNTLGWQWVAGCGADAAPFFRIFNPVSQSEKFDAGGDYIRRWIPELAALPTEWLHAPWKAPSEILSAAHVRLGRTYPAPIVDHDVARKAALAALGTIKGAD